MSLENRLRKLEEHRPPPEPSEEDRIVGPEVEHGRRKREEMWEMQVEWTALHVVRGEEPDFTLDEVGSFITLDGRFAISRRSVDLRGLMGPRTQEIQENMPRERWGEFLEADEEAADILERLLERSEVAEVPEEYREPNHKWTNLGEINDRLGQHDLGSVFTDAEEREATRRLTYTLIHDPEALAMLSDLTRRRDAFVADWRER